jgi:glucokinase
MITLGTGIGGGVIAGGRLLLGAHGYLGEFGHMMIDPAGPPCPCGKRGCWERYASGSAIALEAKRLIDVEGRLGEVVAAAGSADEITAEHIVAAAIDGDGDAAYVLGHFARWMAVGLGSLTMAFDPAMFVIGGGLSRAAPVYEDVLRTRFAEVVYASDLRPLPVLSFAVLGDRAGAVGAALYGA